MYSDVAGPATLVTSRVHFRNRAPLELFLGVVFCFFVEVGDLRDSVGVMSRAGDAKSVVIRGENQGGLAGD